MKRAAAPSRRRPALGLLAVCVTLAVFQLFVSRPVLDHDWVYFDDDINIVLNPHLTGGSWDTVKWAWTNFDYARRYIPLGWEMFDGLFALGGLNPALFHAASWLFAAANTVLLFLIVRKQIEPVGTDAFLPGRAWHDGSALLAVGLVSVHPLQAASVGWASGLLYLVPQFFASLAILVVLPAAGSPLQSARSAFWKKTAGLLLFLCSVLVYPACIGLPLVLVLAETLRGTGDEPSPHPGAFRRALRRYAGWLAVAALVSVVNLIAAATAHAGFNPAAGLGGYPPWTRIQHLVSMVGHYAGRMVWPGETAVYYGPPVSSSPFVVQSAVALGLLALSIALLASQRTRRPAGVMLTLVAASLLPFVGLHDQDQVASDRYTFLAFAVVATGLAHVVSRLARRSSRLAAAVGLIALTALAAGAYRASLAAWRDTDSVQARLDAVTAPQPDPRLSFARPALTDFLRGRFEPIRRRLAEGQKRFGRHPELLSAEQFVTETGARLRATHGGEFKVPPYVMMHLELAREHQANGHARAAEIHTIFAYRLASANSAQPMPGPVPRSP
ncbi:MAG: hypothetical protein EXS37_07185 [Opitutus sp.]|nr:hypothetical protein [Opitutus sp.]